MQDYNNILETCISDEAVLAMELKELIRHGVVVSRLAGLITRELDMSEEFISDITQAGLLHDIGKLRIGHYIYGRKNDELKVEEIKFVRMHAVLSYGILKEQGYNDIILTSVLHHHENFDGSGYPDNLKGDLIPFGARILRLCDVFSALVANRAYRKALQVEDAMKVLIGEIKNYDMKCFLALQRVVHGNEFEELNEVIANNNRLVMKPADEDKDINLDLW